MKLTFGTLPTGVTEGTTNESVVSITDDDVPAVTVSFAQAVFRVIEGESVGIRVNISPAASETIVIPITWVDEAGATPSDYSGVPGSISFSSGDTQQSFTVTAVDDQDDDDNEWIRLGFGPLPAGVTSGRGNVAAVSIVDNDVPAVTVSYEQGTYTVAEGSSVTVKVKLDVAPERTVTVPITHTPQDGATAADYSGVPTSVTFNGGDTEKTFTVTAPTDSDDDDGESVKLGFGTLPAGVAEGTTNEAVVKILDDILPVVTITPDVTEAFSNLHHSLFDVPVPTYTLTRTGSTALRLRVDLNIPQNPFVYRPNGETVTIPVGETSKQVKFGTISYYYNSEAGTLTVEVAARDRYVLGSPSTASITMQRIESPITLELMDGPSFEVSEDAGSVTFTVVATTAAGLPAPSRGWETDETWQMNWGLNSYAAGLGATAYDDYGPISQTRPVTGAWEADGDHFRHESTFRLNIIDDMIDEPDEGLTLILTESTQPFHWEDYIHRVCPDVTCRHTVTIIDDDTAGVTVSKTALTVTEEDTTGDTYTVVLSSQPTADVVVTVAGHAGTDVTAAPNPLTFTSLNWETPQTVTVKAGDDADTTNDSVTLTHSAASTDSGYDGILIADVTVTVADNDTAQVMGVMVTPGNAQLVLNWTAVDDATGYQVQWKSGGESYNTGDRQATVTPGTTTDYTIGGLSNGIEYTVQVIATRTGANDGLPSAEVKGTPVLPAVTVSYEQGTYTVAEGSSITVKVKLSVDPERTVTVPINKAPQGGVTTADYSGVPTSVTFNSGDTEKTFSFASQRPPTAWTTTARV